MRKFTGLLPLFAATLTITLGVGACSDDSDSSSNSALVQSICKKGLAANCDDTKGETVESCEKAFNDDVPKSDSCKSEVNAVLTCIDKNASPTCKQGSNGTTLDMGVEEICSKEYNAMQKCASNAGSGGSSGSGGGGTTSAGLTAGAKTYCSRLLSTGCDDLKQLTQAQCVDVFTSDPDIAKCPDLYGNALQCMGTKVSFQCNAGKTKPVDPSPCKTELDAAHQCSN